ncbi:MAG: RlmE family RNA methyltransferase [Desulfobacterales bacterium]|nr:RlmE family RNA methyltransferase [Desulfobacterales bacterium]
MKRSTAKHSKWEDHYSRRAKKEHFPARSVYKLEEIQRKYKLIKEGDKILDLGCFPGSWVLYAANLTGDKGSVIGVDIKPVTITVPPHVKIYTADIFKVDDQWFKSIGNDFNIVLSDMAPSTTGNKNVDAARSFNLCEAALSVAQQVLIPGGAFVCKIFQGEDFKKFSDQVRINFDKYNIFKPQSSRKASKEIYILGLGKK